MLISLHGRTWIFQAFMRSRNSILKRINLCWSFWHLKFHPFSSDDPHPLVMRSYLSYFTQRWCLYDSYLMRGHGTARDVLTLRKEVGFHAFRKNRITQQRHRLLDPGQVGLGEVWSHGTCDGRGIQHCHLRRTAGMEWDGQGHEICHGACGRRRRPWSWG